MQELVEIKNNTLPVPKVWNGQRVVTFKDIDTVHHLCSGNARRNFSRNRKHFIENEDFYIVTNEKINGTNSSIEKANGTNCLIEKIPPKGITVFTETGYLMIVKSLTDDLSWSVQRQLVNNYFNSNERKTYEAKTNKYPILSEKSEWFKSQESNFNYLCKYYKIDMKTLIHKILLELGEVFRVDDYKIIYERETGKKPRYALDVVGYFPELAEKASEIIEIHLRRAKSRESNFIKISKRKLEEIKKLSPFD